MPSARADAPAAPKAASTLSAPQRAMLRMGLLRDLDLALHLPLRYEDETRLTPVARLRDGDLAQVEGTVEDCRVEQRSRRQLVVRLADDDGDKLVLRFLHFYPSHRRTLAEGQRVRVRGEVRGGFLGKEMVHPVFRAVEPGAPLASAMTPVYPTSAQLPQAYLRKAVAAALARAPVGEVLPPEALPPAPGGGALPSLREALQFLHHPPPGLPLAALEDRSHPAWLRLKFEELLAQQLSQLTARRERSALRAPPLRRPEGDAAGGLTERLLAALPFDLTGAQRRVGAEIAADLARGQPMHRLLQGDVGAGKTVVAALAAAIAIEAGWQCALMAPTEILAEQHFRKLLGWLEPLGLQTAWLSGSRKGKERRDRKSVV
jgi:ATP-dependent DNA helicase RecG